MSEDMSEDMSDEEIAGLGLNTLMRHIVDVRARANAAEERDDFAAEDRERALLRRLKEARDSIEQSLRPRDGERVGQNSVAIMVESVEIEQNVDESAIDPIMLQKDIREMREHLRTIMLVEEKQQRGEQVTPDESVAVEAKSKVIYNLMKATQRLQHMGIKVEQETRFTDAEMSARNAARHWRRVTRNNLAQSRPARGRLQQIRYELRVAAATTVKIIFGNPEHSQGPLQKMLNVSFCFFLFIGCCVGPILLVYFSLFTIGISDAGDADQLLYVIAELVLAFFCCSCFVFCGGCVVLESGNVNDQTMVTTAHLTWCAWLINFALGVSAVAIPLIIIRDHPHLLSSAGTPLNITTGAGIAVMVSGVYVLLWNCCLNPTRMHANDAERAESADQSIPTAMAMPVPNENDNTVESI